MTTGVAPEEGSQRRLIRRRIDGNGDRSHAGPGQRLRAALERLERRACRDHVGRPQQDDRRLSSQRRERTRLAGEVRERKVRRRKRFVHPGGTWRRSRSGSRRTSSSPVDRGLKASVSIVTPFDDPNASVQRHVSEHLRSARGPADRQLHDALARAQTDEQLLRVLRQESGAGLHDLGLAESIGLDGHARADRVAVALGADAGARRATPAVVSKSFRKIRSCGACRAAITTRSGSPSPSMSSTANDRPS